MMPFHQSSLGLDSLLSSPNWYPYHLDAGARTLQFVEMDAEHFRLSPFLDHRIVTPPQAQRHMLPFSEAPAADRLPPLPDTRWVFHNAFCCSTLLTRHLDALNLGLVLREPHSLYELISVKRFKGTGMLPEIADDEWDRLYAFLMALLARRDQRTAPVIIKPTDGCNSLMVPLLQAAPASRGLFIFSTLDRFLVSVLKLPQRHEWARIRLQELSLDRFRRGEPTSDPRTYNIWQTVTLVWVFQMQNLARACAELGPDKLRTLDSLTLVQDPPRALSALTAFFGYNEANRQAGAVDVKTNAKAPNLEYDADRREQDFRKARAELGAQVEAGLQWAEQLLGAHPDSVIGNRLKC